MICSIPELLEITKRTIEQSTPQEKQELREALLQGLSADHCDICGRRRMTLLLDTTSGTLQCHQCVGSAKAKAVFVREPGDLTNEDFYFLRSVGVLWGDDAARKENNEEE